jgi:hypothetical protein
MRVIPTASHMGTIPTFCGIAMDGKGVVGDVVGTKNVIEVCTLPEGGIPVLLPVVIAATGIKRREIADKNMRICLREIFINFIWTVIRIFLSLNPGNHVPDKGKQQNNYTVPCTHQLYGIFI